MNHSISFICCSLVSVEGWNSLSTPLFAAAMSARLSEANASARQAAPILSVTRCLVMFAPCKGFDDQRAAVAGRSYYKTVTFVEGCLGSDCCSTAGRESATDWFHSPIAAGSPVVKRLAQLQATSGAQTRVLHVSARSVCAAAAESGGYNCGARSPFAGSAQRRGNWCPPPASLAASHKPVGRSSRPGRSSMGLRSSVIWVAAFGILCSPAQTDADAAVPLATIGPPQIVTSASGEARLTPDRANILVGVQTRAPTAAAAARENNARQQAIIAAITAAGIPKEQISTENYNVYAETRSDRAGQNPTVIGYVVTNVVRVEVRRTDQVGPVIDAALAKGANQINSLEFFSSSTDAGLRQALTEAIGKARGDAEAMARAAGGGLGQLLELSTADVGPPRPLYRAAAMMDKSAAPTPIEPGELTLRVAVTGRWQFAPNR